MNKMAEKVWVELDDENGDQQWLEVEYEIHFSIDRNYGADADGRRGEETAFIEGYEIFAIYDRETKEDVTEKYKHRKEVIRAIERGY